MIARAVLRLVRRILPAYSRVLLIEEASRLVLRLELHPKHGTPRWGKTYDRALRRLERRRGRLAARS